MSTEMSRCWLD